MNLATVILIEQYQKYYSTYPNKWSIILAFFNSFWSQSIISLGHHFLGSRCYFLAINHFFETSFSRATLSSKFESIILRLNFKKFQHCPSFYRFTFVTLKLPKRTYICSQNPLAADWTCVFRCETDTAVLPPLYSWIRATTTQWKI